MSNIDSKILLNYCLNAYLFVRNSDFQNWPFIQAESK